VASIAFALSTGAAASDVPAASESQETKNLGLLVADFNTDELLVYLGKGDGTFKKFRMYPVGDGPVAVAIGDFNRDGSTDAVTVNMLSDSVTVAFGKGDGTFGRTSSFVMDADKPSSVVVGDFNSDGRLDLAVTNFGTNNVTILLGKGDGTFNRTLNIPLLGKGPSAIVTADFNRDGVLDLMVTNQLSDDVSYLVGDGNGFFVERGRFEVGDEPVALTTGDFNRDGRLDVAVANFGSNDVTILVARNSKEFMIGQRVKLLVGEGPTALATGEYISGKLGLAVANFVSDDVSLAHSEVTMIFTRERRLAATELPTSLTVGDFNNDGKLDLAIIGAQEKRPIALLGVGNGDFVLKR
jgi:hypothetical protein